MRVFFCNEAWVSFLIIFPVCAFLELGRLITEKKSLGFLFLFIAPILRETDRERGWKRSHLKEIE